MRIAIAKPDHGIAGGFERVLDRIGAHLAAGGHEVVALPVDVTRRSAAPFGLPPAPEVAARSADFVGYFGLVEAFMGVDARRADVLLSTQPPSFVVPHPRHLSLFYHHARTFYDLAEVCLAAGLVDPAAHVAALDRIRRFDQVHLAQVGWFLAGSQTVAGRLAAFNGLADNVSVFHAGLGVDPTSVDDGRGPVPDGHALCVSRHEFPKRTELFVQAMAVLDGRVPGVAVGGGGRLGWARQVHLELRDGGRDPLDPSPAIWRCAPGYVPPDTVPEPARPVVALRGQVPDAELAELYRGALCVVAPAFQEDYGLTAIEAMALGKPVIVCEDGGGLTEFVEHGRNGLVVAPDGPAIAAAVARLRDDHDLARELGRAGRETAARYSWTNAMAEFDAGLAAVCG